MSAMAMRDRLACAHMGDRRPAHDWQHLPEEALREREPVSLHGTEIGPSAPAVEAMTELRTLIDNLLTNHYQISAAALAFSEGRAKQLAQEKGTAATEGAATQASTIDIHGFMLPEALAAMAESIERSRAMLDLQDNWDDEGSPSYAETTWRRAIQFVIDTATSFLRHRNVVPPAPMILKGPEASIDILWSSPRRQMLLNIPAEEDQPVTLGGHDRESEDRVVEGSLDPSERNEWLLVWITE